MANEIESRSEQEPQNRTKDVLEKLFRLANPQTVPTGILHWSHLYPYWLAELDGGTSIAACDQPAWQQLYLELQTGALPQTPFTTLEAVTAAADSQQREGLVPIALAHYRYNTPKKSTVAAVVAALREGTGERLPNLTAPERLLKEGRAFFASALLPAEFIGFTRQPYIHSGLAARFVVPRQLYLTNVEGEPERLEIDFDDGEGYREVQLDTPVEILYGDDSRKHLRVRLTIGNALLQASFHFAVREKVAPQPNETWELKASIPYEGKLASGTAWVVYGKGHTSLINPVIFADGFPGGRSYATLWNAINQKGFGTQLLEQGKDLVILGYNDGSLHIQATAFLGVACIQKTIERRTGTAPLLVSGASMGGLVMRYTLAYMEQKGMDHQAATYLSFDTPHQGASIPLMMQNFLYYFESENEMARAQAKLLRSPAAQQMLYVWVPSYDYAGPIGQNPLKLQFRQELNSLGGFPKKPKKLGVANGTGKGAGNGIPAGVEAFNWYDNCVGARPRTAPNGGVDQYMGDLWYGLGWWKYHASHLPAYDGAPGGRSETYGAGADAAKASGRGEVKIYHRQECFVPSISALSIWTTSELYVNISQLPASSSNLDDFCFSSSNTMHTELTDELVAWLLKKLSALGEDLAEREAAAA